MLPCKSSNTIKIKAKEPPAGEVDQAADTKVLQCLLCTESSDIDRHFLRVISRD